MLFRCFCFAVALSLATTCQAAEPVGIATVVDGDAVLIRQTTKQILLAGSRLTAYDLIETGPTTGIVRVEFANGAIADLGPGTSVMVAPKLDESSPQDALVYAVKGWAKITVSTKAAPSVAPSSLLLANMLGVSSVNGSAVVMVSDSESSVFCETGTMTVHERRKGRLLTALALKSGSFYAKSEQNKPSVSALPSVAFTRGVPKAFLDPIPLRASLYQNKPEPKPRNLGELGYADAAPWLAAEAGIKGILVAQWRSQLNSGLRAGLMANIKSHPEWDRILFPEKYILKAPISSSSKSL